MKFVKLFEPIVINKLELKNRIVMPAMVTNFGNADNTVSPRLIAYHVARAKGGFGLCIVENFAVHPWGKAFGAVLGLWDDRFIADCARLTEAVHRENGKIFAQIYHAGAQTTQKAIGAQPVAPTALLHPGNGTLPRVLSIKEIEEIIEAFGLAAWRAKQAGFDGVEIHGSHGYLISEFMSPYTNKRTDEYGGNLMGRLRFPLDILKSVRDRTGGDYPVIIRMAGEERISDGIAIEESKIIVQILDAAGYDGFHITTANTASQHYVAPPYYIGLANNVQYAEKIKKVTAKPVITTGRINDPLMAESILSEGRADMIGMGRAAIADPDMPNKAAQGNLAEIQYCVGCLQGCIGKLYYDLPICCLANSEVGKESEPIGRAAGRKKLLIVGGGIAGLEVARIAALRGHETILCEKTDKLGGQLRIACMPPHKQAISQLVKQKIQQARQAGVDIRLNSLVTEKSVAEINPDLVVLATGGQPIVPPIPAADGANVSSAWDVLLGKLKVGKKVLVVGGGSVGCETADFLAAQGKTVTIVEMRDEIGIGIVQRVKHFLLKRLKDAGVETQTSATVCAFIPGGASVEQFGERKRFTGYDDVVLALGTKADNALQAQLENSGYKTILAGDAGKPGDALDALCQARDLGCSF